MQRRKCAKIEESFFLFLSASAPWRESLSPLLLFSVSSVHSVVLPIRAIRVIRGSNLLQSTQFFRSSSIPR